MEKKKVLPFAVVGVFLLTSAVISQAGDWMDKSSGSETQVSQEMEIADPEFGINEYGDGGAPADLRGPVETGTLQDRKSMEQASDISAPEFWTDEYSAESGSPAEFWGPVETGTLPGSDESSRLLDTGVDPSRWEESGE